MATKFIVNYPIKQNELDKLAKVEGPQTFVGGKPDAHIFFKSYSIDYFMSIFFLIVN